MTLSFLVSKTRQRGHLDSGKVGLARGSRGRQVSVFWFKRCMGKLVVGRGGFWGKICFLHKREVEENLCLYCFLRSALHAAVLRCNAWYCCSHFLTVRGKTERITEVPTLCPTTIESPQSIPGTVYIQIPCYARKWTRIYGSCC